MQDRKNLKFIDESWYARKTVNGKTKHKKLNTKNLRVAQKRRDDWLAKIGAGKTRKRRYPLNEACEKFAEDHFPNLKPKAARRYETSMFWLIEHFKTMCLTKISSVNLHDFEKWRKAMDITDSTIIKDLRCLSSIYTQAGVWEWTDRNPVIPYLKGRKRSKALLEGDPRERYLTREEEHALLEQCTDRFRPLVIFAIDTGLRREEQFSLEWPKLLLNDREVKITAEIAKSRKNRSVPLMPRTLNMMKQWPRSNQNNFVFLNSYGDRYSQASPWIWESLQKAVRRAGLDENLEWHDLRRTCGCRLLQDYAFSMEEVSEWLGHSSIKVTQDCYAFLKKDQLHKSLEKGAKNVLLPTQNLGVDSLGKPIRLI